MVVLWTGYRLKALAAGMLPECPGESELLQKYDRLRDMLDCVRSKGNGGQQLNGQPWT